MVEQVKAPVDKNIDRISVDVLSSKNQALCESSAHVKTLQNFDLSI